MLAPRRVTRDETLRTQNCYEQWLLISNSSIRPSEAKAHTGPTRCCTDCLPASSLTSELSNLIRHRIRCFMHIVRHRFFLQNMEHEDDSNLRIEELRYELTAWNFNVFAE
jgi:hypothetical protein